MIDILEKKIWVAGHNGMVGSSILRKLEKEKCKILKAEKKELNLLDQKKTQQWIQDNKPDIIILAAAKVGGIKFNMLNKSAFLYENLMIQNNIIYTASKLNIDKLVFIGSSCIYPKNSPQPIPESSLMKGPLEETNEGYALAKIAGLKLCKYLNEEFHQKFISVMPSNVFGVNDNFDPDNSHVLGALLRKIYQAKVNGSKKIEIWGTGKPRREFLYVDDLADAIFFLIKNYNSSLPINVGTSKDISITELAVKIAKVLDHKIEIEYNSSMPDGTYLKRLDTTKLTKLGWKPKISLEDGIKKTFNYCTQNNIFS
ncbi:MAG: GDP-fucose synthetase [Pelagibacterales bacterium]|nr:GDP-fucose synthetase [Pelagibacterales bacterium]|tara:strand:+ start:3146 stop:4084 length:939 start_codon:yes stop_codon:yes gene_type:complete